MDPLQQVLLAEVGGVHAQRLGQQVELALVGEEPLRVARRAHVPARHLVGVHHVLFHEGVGHVVGAGGLLRTAEDAVGLERAVGAGVEDEVHVVGGDGTVLPGAGLDLDDGGVARVAGDELLVVVHDDLDRPPAALLRQRVAKGDVHEVALAAEVAADVARMHHDGLGVHLYRRGHLAADAVGHLAARPDLGRARLRIGPGHAGMRLDVRLVHLGRGEGVLDDDVRLLEPLLDVALLPVDVDHPVGGGVELLRQPLVGVDIRVQQRRRRLHGLDGIEHGVHFLVLDLDEGGGFLGGVLGLRGHRRHLLADEAHDAVRHDRHVHHTPADAQSGDVLAGEDADHPRHLHGLAGVDALDAAVGDGAAQDLAPEHVRERHIHRVLGLAAYLVLAVDSGCGNPHAVLFRHWLTSGSC